MTGSGKKLHRSAETAVRFGHLAVAAALAASAAGADAGPLRCTSLDLRLREAGPAPLQYQEFCAANPGDCDMSGPDRLVLDPGDEMLIDRINRTVNAAVTPMPDLEWRGVEDVWSYPVLGCGDCEDVALEKRRRLVGAGLPRAAFTLAIGYPRSAPSPHVVLLAETDQGTWALDQRADVLTCWDAAGLNYESRERPDGRWSHFDQSLWDWDDG